MSDNQQGGEAIDEVVTYQPKGTMIRQYCSIGGQLYFQYADGMGSSYDVYQGVSLNCTNSITRDNLASHLSWYVNLTGNINMLKMAEAVEINKQLRAFIDLVKASTYVMETSEGCYVCLLSGPRKMTFWETLKWKMFGAVPYAKSQNELISEAYTKAGVVTIMEDQSED